MNWLVKVKIKLKESILDPQGQAVTTALEALGYKNVADLQVGKYIELTVNDLEKAEKVKDQVEEMCQRLLANPVSEDYDYEIEELA